MNTGTGINFVNADQGGLIFRIECAKEGTIRRRADSIEDGVYWVQRYGTSSNGIYFSSDMDFCTEEGFEKPGDAVAMFDKIMEEATQ